MYPLYSSSKSAPENHLGFVTDNKVIMYRGTEANIIYLKNIRKIDLIKERKFDFNLLFMLVETLIACFLFYNSELRFSVKFIMVILTAVAMLMSVFYKFYFYKIVVYLNDNQSLTFEASHLKKAEAKQLYFSIKRKLQKTE